MNVLEKCLAGLKRAALLALITGFGLGNVGVVSAQPASEEREALFAEAAAEFQVPKEVLLGVGYTQSRWENHKGQPSASGGYGIMHLTGDAEPKDGRGEPLRPVRGPGPKGPRTLDEAAAELKLPADLLKRDDRQNIRGAAALLARYARETNDGQTPSGLGDWFTAVARLSSANDAESAQDFAEEVYKTLQSGAARSTEDGQNLALSPQAARPNRSKLDRLRLPSSGRRERSSERSSSEAECPYGLTCKFVPARFAQNNPTDPIDYGNYDQANRPHDMKIKYIVIHDTEGSYQSAIDWFQDPRSYVAAHYVIRSSDGEVTQMVKNEDVAWHAGNWYVNMHSIGVEHEGFAAEGATWYTEAMYRSSAKLVRYLAQKYNVPIDREHIVGHDQYHAPTPGRVPGMHWDPGPYWDWDHYMNLLYAPTLPTAGSSSKVVTIAPKFATNLPPLTNCASGVCTSLPAQPANFVYLRTAPNATASLLTDAGLRPDGTPGTIEINDWSAKATHGQHFAVAERQGDWTAIWFGGQKGWFYNPAGEERTALPARFNLITPKDGASPIPVYGRPLPEPAAYATTGAPVQTIVPLQYTIPAGQAYPVYDKEARNDYFHVLAFDRSTPGDGTITVGEEKYIPISYNHRQAYVKASDVKQFEQ